MIRPILLLALLLAGCNREVKYKEESLPQPLESIVSIDSFSIPENAFADKILIRGLGHDLKPDSTGISKFKIEFLKDRRSVKSFPFEVPYQRDQGSWTPWREVFTDSVTNNVDRRFVILSNGFEACGYPQYSLLFFVDKEVELIDDWVSFSDGGLGTWREFFPLFNGRQVTEFRHRMVSSEEVEGPAGETLFEVTYRDSTVMRQSGSKWLKDVITVPDVRYRTEVYTENEYYN